MKRVLFQASLSNGEQITEEKGNFQTIEGALSPWQRLLVYLKEKNATITSLSLHTKDGQRWNIPSAGNNPKFHAISVAPKPVRYDFFRKMGADVMDTNGTLANEEHYSVVEAEYEDGTKMQVWVDEKTCNSWSFIV